MKTPLFLLTLVVGFIAGNMVNKTSSSKEGKVYNTYIDLRGATVSDPATGASGYYDYGYDSYEHVPQDDDSKVPPSQKEEEKKESSIELDASTVGEVIF
jgi:hypothetical protein